LCEDSTLVTTSKERAAKGRCSASPISNEVSGKRCLRLQNSIALGAADHRPDLEELAQHADRSAPPAADVQHALPRPERAIADQLQDQIGIVLLEIQLRQLDP